MAFEYQASGLTWAYSEHLDRTHCESPHQCPTCGACFVEQVDHYNNHISSRVCDEKEHSTIKFSNRRSIGIIRDNLRRQSFGRGNDEEAKWVYVFERLFGQSAENIDPRTFKRFVQHGFLSLQADLAQISATWQCQSYPCSWSSLCEGFINSQMTRKRRSHDMHI